jgi:hypothetical protein
MGLFDHHTPKKAEVLPPAPMPELIFHDSLPLPEEKLPEARETAVKQKGIILDVFRQRFSMNFTPIEIHNIIGETMLLTSVRRSITDLTKEGKLIKCDWSESREGAYGKPNRVWRYNTGYMPSLNPKK